MGVSLCLSDKNQAQPGQSSRGLQNAYFLDIDDNNLSVFASSGDP
jgi:hypothetical protein